MRVKTQDRSHTGVRAVIGGFSFVAAAVLFGACGGPATPAGSPSPVPSTAPSSAPASTSGAPTASPAPSKPASSPSTQEPVGDQVKIAVTIKDGKVDPSGKKIDVPIGATVVLNVTSDADDEIHAHVGSGDGYSLEVQKGVPAQGQFDVDESGSFEIESHELGKVIAILNVR